MSNMRLWEQEVILKVFAKNDDFVIHPGTYYVVNKNAA